MSSTAFESEPPSSESLRYLEGELVDGVRDSAMRLLLEALDSDELLDGIDHPESMEFLEDKGVWVNIAFLMDHSSHGVPASVRTKRATGHRNNNIEADIGLHSDTIVISLQHF